MTEAREKLPPSNERIRSGKIGAMIAEGKKIKTYITRMK